MDGRTRNPHLEDITKNWTRQGKYLLLKRGGLLTKKKQVYTLNGHKRKETKIKYPVQATLFIPLRPHHCKWVPSHVSSDLASGKLFSILSQPCNHQPFPIQRSLPVYLHYWLCIKELIETQFSTQIQNTKANKNSNKVL
jgi:hypothetical protein